MQQYNINQMNTRLLLEENKKVSDGIGGFIEQWQEVKSVWGYMENISANSSYDFIKLNIKLTHLVVIRYFNNITSNMRFRQGDRIFNIKYVNNVKNRFYEIYCEEVV